VRAAFTAAATLYGLVAILLAASLPAQVPVSFGTDLTAERWASRGQLMLLICVLGMLLVAVFAGLATQLPHAGTDLWHVGAVTLLFLTVEFALVYGQLGGSVAASSFAEAQSVQVDRLSPWAVGVLAAYLAYVLGWLAWVLTGRDQVRSGPRRAPLGSGTADSPV
jgi:hypothetical protein